VANTRGLTQIRGYKVTFCILLLLKKRAVGHMVFFFWHADDDLKNVFDFIKWAKYC